MFYKSKFIIHQFIRNPQREFLLFFPNSVDILPFCSHLLTDDLWVFIFFLLSIFVLFSFFVDKQYMTVQDKFVS